MKNILFILIFGISICVKAQSPGFQFEWAGKAGNANIDKANALAYDVNGNVFSAGYFGGTVDFDPGVGTSTLTSSGAYDAFIQKLDQAGNFVAAYKIGSTSDDIINDIEIDGSGNIYISGYFTGNVDFDVTAGVSALNSGTVQSGFIAKYNSSMSLTWVKMLTGASAQWVNDIAVDNSGNVYSTGGIKTGTIDFDPNVGTSSFTSARTAFFVHKLSSTGNFVWGKGFDSPNTIGTVLSYGNVIELDATGNPIIGGRICISPDFDPGAGVVTHTTGTSSAEISAFLLKLTAAGNYSFSFVIDQNLGVEEVMDMKIDNSGNIGVVGSFGNGADFDPSASTYTIGTTGGSSWDGFVAKYSNVGAFMWATQANLSNSNGADIAHCLDIDASGNLFVVNTYSPSSVYNSRISKFNSSGVFQNSTSIPNTSFNDIKMDFMGSIIVCGTFSTTVDFNLNPIYSYSLTSSGQGDVVVAKYSECFGPSSLSSISGNLNLCNGSVNTYSVTNVMDAIGYVWANNLGMVGTSTTNIISLTSAQTATTGTISVYAYNQCAAITPIQTVQVNVVPNTTVTIASSTLNVCPGTAVSFTASGAANYTWSSGETTASIVKSPTTTTTYTVTGTNGNCSNSRIVTVTVQPAPNISIAVNQSTMMCSGSPAILTASGANSYVWNTGSTSNSISVTPSVTTVYTVTGTSSFGCVANKTTTVNIQTPILNVSASAYSICPGGSTTMSVSGAQTYTWNGPGGLFYGSTYVVTPTVNATYLVGGTGFTGCTSQTSISINVTSGITVNATASSSVSCSGAPVLITASGASTYGWVGTGVTTNTISVSPTVPTTYTVNGASGSCTGSKTISIGVATNPNVNAMSSTTLLCEGQSTALNASASPSLPGMTYTWSTAQTTQVITVTPTVTTTYTVVGKNLQGCTDDAVITVSVSACTGIEDVAKPINNSINVFPNPNNGVFTITSVEGSYSLINSIGEIVRVIEVRNDSEYIDVKNLPQGIYYIIGKTAKTKIIITK